LNKFSASPKRLNYSDFLKHRTTLSSFLLLIALNGVSNAQAQAPPPSAAIDTSETVDYAFLPALAYSSDLGLVGGGIMSRYKFADDITPFYSYLHFNAVASTKGLISSTFLFDKPQFSGKDQRLTTELYISRFLQSQFYGIGNYNELPKALRDRDDFYFYKSFSTGAEITFRKPIFKKTTQKKLDIFANATFEYRSPWGNDSDQYIIQQQPFGVDGTRAASLGGGLIWDNRDNEFEPSKGLYGKAGVKIGNNIWGSSDDYFLFESDVRTYKSFNFLRTITFANRLTFHHASGDAAYWLLPELGGEDLMRGYPENRFRDDNALLLNTEFRTWLIEWPEFDIRLGGTLFMDVGRTFPTGAPFSVITDDLKYSFGFGGTSSFFNRNFILRGDVGFSPEGYGIYFTAGYLF
jgi:outer membrane protein assembly factor BamA